MGTASHTLAEFVASVRYDDIPDAVAHAAKRHVLDTIGVALAAAGTGSAAPSVDMTRSWAGARESSVIGYDFAAPAPYASLVNGTLAHALEFDDTHVESVVHPSAVVVPAALAVAEEVGTGGKEMLTAAIAGYEVAARIGAAAPGRFGARGYDATGLAGTFAAAAVAARLWGLTPDETAHAFGIAGSQSSGLFAALADGSETRSFHAGWAAHGGIIAADLARRGFTGPSTVFEGPLGFYDVFLHGEEPDQTRLVRGLGHEWETARIALKPHAACHFLHAYMDAAARANVKWADIEEVICFVPPAIVPIIAEPRTTRLHPSTAYAAQYSLPFAVATAIVGGRETLEMFGADARADRRVLTLAERVRHQADPSIHFPQIFGGRVRVHTRSGRQLDMDEPVNRGHPDRPLSDSEVTDKFLRNARERLDARVARRLMQRLQRLESIEQIDTLAELLRTG
ncbi:MAG TPA: MmgE/PrpD family protein [Actinomycetota bacterium]|nr:MmgE/PrpD family protein [Actinomycetota bacterium]